MAFAQQLPAFSFKDLKEQKFTREQVKTGIPTIVIFFDPYCDHCAQQADWIAGSADAFKQINLVWVTTEMKDATEEFVATHFSGAKLPYQHFLLDTEFMFDGYFGYSEVPSIYLYNAAGKRVKSLDKETPADALLKYLGEGK